MHFRYIYRDLMKSEIWYLNNIWIEIAKELFEPIIWAGNFKIDSPIKIKKQSSEDVNSEDLNESKKPDV